MEFSKEESLNKNYADIFAKYGVIETKRYTITVSPTSATLRCNSVHKCLPNGGFTIKYDDLTKDDEPLIIYNWMKHVSRTDTPDIENAVRIIRSIMIEIYEFIKSIANKFNVRTARYAEWYTMDGCQKRSKKDAHSRWVTMVACDAILENIGRSKFELYEFS